MNDAGRAITASILLLILVAFPSLGEVSPPPVESWQIETGGQSWMVRFFESSEGRMPEVVVELRAGEERAIRRRLSLPIFVRDVGLTVFEDVVVVILHGHPAIYLLVADRQSLAPVSFGPVSGASLSPSERYLLVTEFRPLHGPSAPPDLELLDLSLYSGDSPAVGGERGWASLLSEFQPRRTRTAHGGPLVDLEHSGVWSPEEDRFVFAERREELFMIHLVDLEGPRQASLPVPAAAIGGAPQAVDEDFEEAEGAVHLVSASIGRAEVHLEFDIRREDRTESRLLSFPMIDFM